jgi:Domain of unknown function (DUF4389)
MSAFTFEVDHTEARNRVTVAFRIILAIPHLIIAQAWGQFVQVLAFVQWFIVLFTGQRNEGLWSLQRAWLNYDARVVAYTSLLFDQYPAFATDTGPAPVRSDIRFEAPANRLSNALRIIWMIPAMVIAFVLSIGGIVVVVVSWFAVVFTGRQPKGMWDFLVRVVRFVMRAQSYALLMTDTYPKYESA